ncbi:hypothetical protein B0H13DRAFT_1866386 [Mycena leptocephala]|nr:hypothetical protein B0H13DRAFT_1866386 [Mycena leptocephala]
MPLGNSSLAAICMEKGILSFDCPISFIVPPHCFIGADVCEVPIFRRYRTPLELVKIQVVRTGAYYTNESARTATSREYLRQQQLRAAATCGKVSCELRPTASVVSAIRPRMMPDAEGPSLTNRLAAQVKTRFKVPAPQQFRYVAEQGKDKVPDTLQFMVFCCHAFLVMNTLGEV